MMIRKICLVASVVECNPRIIEATRKRALLLTGSSQVAACLQWKASSESAKYKRSPPNQSDQERSDGITPKVGDDFLKAV